MVALLVLGAATSLILFGIQLSIQSSYYADPTQRLCGTLDRWLVSLNNLTNRMITFVSRGRIPPVPSESLAFYDGVSQWWWLKVPSENRKATHRFAERRREKLGC